MRRVARFIFNGLTICSAVLCVAAAVLWVRSYVCGETFHWWGEGREASVIVGRGRVSLYKVWEATRPDEPTEFTYNRWPPTDLGDRAALLKSGAAMRWVGPVAGLGAFWESESTGARRLFVEVWVPHWFVVALTGAVPAVRGWRWVRRRRRRQEDRATVPCPACGYDVRATPGQCPECGWGADGDGAAGTRPHSGQRAGVARRS